VKGYGGHCLLAGEGLRVPHQRSVRAEICFEYATGEVRSGTWVKGVEGRGNRLCAEGGGRA
jgi:hypothetical protein